jgi:hypothetical protein
MKAPGYDGRRGRPRAAVGPAHLADALQAHGVALSEGSRTARGGASRRWRAEDPPLEMVFSVSTSLVAARRPCSLTTTSSIALLGAPNPLVCAFMARDVRNDRTIQAHLARAARRRRPATTPSCTERLIKNSDNRSGVERFTHFSRPNTGNHKQNLEVGRAVLNR